MFSKLKGALIKAVNSIDIASESNQLTDRENAAASDGSGRKKSKSKNGPNLKYRYTRPNFLKLLSDDEILVSADQMIRPIIVPRYINEMPWNAGYAE
jgi:protein phosphatase 2C zeta, putative (fragment)